MNQSSVIYKIGGVIWAIVWRVVLTAVILGALAAVGLGMALNVVLTGPSEAARDTLTATLLEYESTRSIPGHFLDQAAIDAILAADDTLPAAVSDLTLIKPDAAASGTETDTITAENYTAQITLISAPAEAEFSATQGEHYVGFTDDGVMVAATSADEAAALGITGRCEKILMMDGMINTGLYTANSGFAPRCAMGQRADGTVILVTVTGGEKDVPGATWRDLIDIMTEYGAVNACSLDCGASASEE